MVERARGRQLARLIAVILGVALWWPTLGPKLAQPSSPEFARVDAGRTVLGELEEGDGVSEVSEDGQGEDSEESFDDAQSLAAPLHLPARDPMRIEVASPERMQLGSAHDVLARERGPPLS